MAELLKNIYHQEFFAEFTRAVKSVKKDFDAPAFINQIFDRDWEDKALKQRMRHITLTMKNHLSEDFTENSDTLLSLIPQLIQQGFKPDNLEFIFLPDFIEIYGINDYPQAIRAFEQITQFVTCEFAVRPFIIKYEQEMIDQMVRWSKHKHPSVRRLSSEGCRPRLPWAMAIPSLKADPIPILPILDILKNDESESVRRSVANNLNDISKDNPSIVIILVKEWKGKSEETDRLIKHACRTLLKQGVPEVLELFGFGSIEKIEIDQFKILTPTVKIGGYLEFSFIITNHDNSLVKVRLEYALYYQKANGSLAKKIYQISEKSYPEHSSTDIYRKQHFKIITTRKLYVGKHQLALIINGTEGEKLNFVLVE